MTSARKPHPSESTVPAAACHDMPAIRREIDRVDRELVRLLAERLTYIERAGVIKNDRNTVRDEARIQDVLDKVKTSCERENFPYGIAEPMWRALMEGCIVHEFVVWDEVNQVKPRAVGG